MNQILMCHSPVRRGVVDEIFDAEFEAAKSAGFEVALVDHDEILTGNYDRALLNSDIANELWLYRGWMMPVHAYQGLVKAMSQRGALPYVSSANYQACHQIPGWYPFAENHTPVSKWLEHLPPYTDHELAALGESMPLGPCIIKDFVKSEKQAWNEACFVPDVQNLDGLRRVTDAFCSLRGSQFEGGLVLRQYIELCSKSTNDHGRPETDEWRVFFVNGEVAMGGPGFESVGESELPDLGAFSDIAKAIGSPLLSMDIAWAKAGHPVIIEIGDGQVSGLPDSFDTKQFYERLRDMVS